MADEFPSRTLDKIVIRVPDGMRDEIAEVARLNGRSMNSEIVTRLAWSLKAGSLAKAVQLANPDESLRAKTHAATERIGLRLAELSAELETLAAAAIAEASSSPTAANPGNVIRRANEHARRAHLAQNAADTEVSDPASDSGPSTQRRPRRD